MTKHKKRSLFYLVLSFALIGFYQNCSQNLIQNPSAPSSSDSASKTPSQKTEDYPAKSLAQLQQTCSLEKENLEITPVRPLSTAEYKNAILGLFPNYYIKPTFETIFGQLPMEELGDSISTYIRFPNARAFLTSERTAIYHQVALTGSSRISNATGTTGVDVDLIRGGFDQCYNPTAMPVDCLDKMLNAMGRRAFRRPLTAEQLADAKIAMGSSGTLQDRLGKAFYYFAMSPNFLLHMNVDGTVQDGILTLDQYGLASKMSFFLIGSPPNDYLLDLAKNNQLQTQSQIFGAADYIRNNNQVAFRAQMIVFLKNWLKLPTSVLQISDKMVALESPSTQILANRYNLITWFNDELYDMFMYYLQTTPGTYLDFFTNEKSFAKDAPLASIYDVPVWAGGSAVPPSHKPNQRAGFLTTATMLSSRGDVTNPFAMGGNIYKHVLCRQFGDAPLPQFQPALNPAEDSALLTTRERFEKLVPRGSSCMKCHVGIESLGMPMQDYDVFGRHRLGFEKIVSPTGALVGVKPVDTYQYPEIGGKPNQQVRSGVDLIHQLAKTTEPQACFARQLIRFSNARLDSKRDSCMVARLTEKLVQGSMWDAIKSLMADPAFAKRRIQ